MIVDKMACSGWIRLCLWITLGSLILLSGCASQAKIQRHKEASAHYKLGLSYLNDNMIQQAYVEFQKAIELNPDERDSHYALGHIYFVQQKYDDAMKEFETVLKIDSDYGEAHNYLGKVYERKGMWDKAVRHYKKALSRPTYPTPDIAHYNLGVVYQSNDQVDDAIKEYRRAVIINPDHLLAHYAIAQLYSKTGQYRQAVNSYLEVLRLFPESAEARYQLAWVYLKSNAVDQAVSEFSTIVNRFPDSELAGRSRRHMEFLKTKVEKLRVGMTEDQVMKVLGKSDRVVRTMGPTRGHEEWLLGHYDLVLLFEGGHFAGYQEGPRK